MIECMQVYSLHIIKDTHIQVSANENDVIFLIHAGLEFARHKLH